MRTWLYRIATNTCLTALDSRQRRPLPTGLGAPSSDPVDDIVARDEVPWLEPLPDDSTDPSTIVGSRESVRLAFVAALQHLSARQRAVLVLREVLQWKAAEVADAIGSSTAAVNSLLQRARAQLDAVGPSEDDQLQAPESPEAQDLLTRYIAAFESYDMDKLVELFTAEAVWEMPPFDGWYQGPENIVLAVEDALPRRESGRHAVDPHHRQWSARRRDVHAQPRDRCARALPDACPAVTADGISHVVAFHMESFEAFGLPATL